MLPIASVMARACIHRFDSLLSARSRIQHLARDALMLLLLAVLHSGVCSHCFAVLYQFKVLSHRAVDSTY